MTLSQLHQEVLNNNLQSFYVFTGMEWLVQRKYIEQISKVTNRPMKYIDNFKSIYKSLSSSLFNDSFVYVVRDDADLLTQESLWKQIKDDLLKNNTLILLVTSVDKRKKFFTTFKDNIVEFEALKPHILKQYIQREIDLSDKECDILMEVCEYDYGRCLLEIDKVKRSGKSLIELLQEGAIYTPPQDTVFKFVDAVLDKKLEMFELLDESYESGENTFVLLSVLYTNAKQLLQVQSCDSKDIAKVTGLNSWEIKRAKQRQGDWWNSELIHLMRLCQQAEKNIKIGQIDEQYAVEYVLINSL
jgi:DNA polymerase III delta subunit